jgi:iron complex outermembrane recepter protein
VVWMPKREFIRYTNVETGDTLSGNKLQRAPETSATAAFEYLQPLAARGSLRARLEYLYRSGYFYTVENNPDFFQRDFGLLNAIIDFEAESGRWYAFASGRNLTDEDYFYQVFVQSSPGLPATYEIGAGYRF